MTTYVAFLRAINVGGRGVVRMTDLRDAFAAAGCANPRTYIASGNVVFEAPRSGQEALFANVGRRVGTLLGATPGICFRTLADIDRLIEADPFARVRNDPRVKRYVAFLTEKPHRKPALPMLLPREGLEAFAMAGREIFVLSWPKASGMYGFPNNFIEMMGVTATTRNWSTVTKVVEFARR